MEQNSRLAFRFDCGATWLNLLATSGQHFSARPVERIATPERLRVWLELSEVSPAQPPDQADLRQTWRLREVLRPLALAVAEGTPPPAEAASHLAAFLDRAPDPVTLVAADRLLRERPRTTTAALARVARQAVDHLVGVERQELAVCPEQDCRGVFANPSGRRRWCPSPACASRGRVRALRERRRTGSGTPDPPTGA